MTASNQSNSQNHVLKRLKDTIPQIEEAKAVANAPSVSTGVFLGQNVLFTKSTGLRDVENNEFANADTSYHIGSCGKIITSAAIGVLVDEGEISWQDAIHKHLPAFNPVGDPEIGKKATIIDVCRHSTGLANANVVFMGPHGAPAIKTEKYMDMINALPTANDHGQRFRSWWYYSNAAYGLLALVVKAVTGKEFSTFLRTRICDPLGLTQTLLTEDDVARNTNRAHPYVKIDDGWHRINNGLTSKGHSHTLPFLGIWSSVKDILHFCGAVMDRYETERARPPKKEMLGADVYSSGRSLGRTQALGIRTGLGMNPLRQMSTIWNWYWSRPYDDGFDNKTAYMLGWLRTTIPSSALPFLSYNSSPAKDEYIIGKKSTPRVLYGHSGCVNGSVATIYVVPESRVAVVALSNAADAGDASNTSAQLLLQAVFELGPTVDLILSLKESREMKLKQHEDMINDWHRHRNVSKYKCQPGDLVGTYHGLGASVIDIVESENPDSGLAVIFGGQPASRCELQKFNRNSLSFLPLDHKEILRRAMIDWDYWTVGIFNFVREDESQPNSPFVGFRWKWDQYDDSTLWVRMHDHMPPDKYDAVVKKHGKPLKDPWAEAVNVVNGNGHYNGNGSCKDNNNESIKSEAVYQMIKSTERVA